MLIKFSSSSNLFFFLRCASGKFTLVCQKVFVAMPATDATASTSRADWACSSYQSHNHWRVHIIEAAGSPVWYVHAAVIRVVSLLFTKAKRRRRRKWECYYYSHVWFLIICCHTQYKQKELMSIKINNSDVFSSEFSLYSFGIFVCSF